MNDRKISLQNWLVVILLSFTMVFSIIDRFALSLLIEPIKSDLGISDAEIGLLNGIAFGLFYACMGLPLGWLADRWSRKGTILTGVTVWSAATAACGLSGNFIQLMLARICVGAGEAGLAPASYSLIHDRFTKQSLNRAMSIFQLGAVVGAGVALIVSGAVYHYFESGGVVGVSGLDSLAAWQKTFIAIAMPGIIFVVLIAMIGDRAKRVPAARHQTKQDLVTALRQKPMLYGLLFIGMSGLILAQYALMTWIPAILQREWNWSPEKVSAIYGPLVLVTSPVGLLAGGWICDVMVARGKHSAQATIGFIAAIGSLPLALFFALPQQVWIFLSIVALLQLFLSLPIGVAPALIQIETTASVRGRVSALYVLVVNIVGLGIGPVLIGAIASLEPANASALREAVMFVVTPFVSLSALLLWLLCRRAALERQALSEQMHLIDE